MLGRGGVLLSLAVVAAAGCSGPEPPAGDPVIRCPEPLRSCDVRERSCQEHTFRATACLRELSGAGPYPRVSVVDRAPAPTPEVSAVESSFEIALSLATPEAIATVTPRGPVGSTAGKTILITSPSDDPQNGPALQRILAHELTHLFQASAQMADGGFVYDFSPAEVGTTESRLVGALIPEGEATFYETMAASALDGAPFDAEVARGRARLDEWLAQLVSPNNRALPLIRARFAHEAGFWLFADAWGRGRQAAMKSLVAAPPASSLVVFGEPATKLDVPKHTPPSWATSSSEDELGPVTVHANAMRRGVTAPIAKAWRGDRLTTFRRTSDKDIAIVWTIRFATEADATAFAEKPPTIPGVTVEYGAQGSLGYVLVGGAELRPVALGQ